MPASYLMATGRDNTCNTHLACSESQQPPTTYWNSPASATRCVFAGSCRSTRFHPIHDHALLTWLRCADNVSGQRSEECLVLDLFCGN